MAMIMKYHQYPERGTGSYNGVNFDVEYDWANMRMDNYRYGYSESEAEAVSTLIYHAAASIDTQFGYSGSSAYEVKVPANSMLPEHTCCVRTVVLSKLPRPSMPMKRPPVQSYP